MNNNSASMKLEKMPKVIGKYKNGNYGVVLLSDGTKVRASKDDEFIPAFSENCDVKITDKCGMNCPFCYEGCSREGKHAELLNWKWLESLHPYTELALNGNDLDHPQLEEFLTKLREKDVIPNITVHCMQFLVNLHKIRTLQEKGLIFGIGISISGVGEINQRTAILASKNLKNCVFHTIAGVTTQQEYEMLAENECKVLVLGYKELGRGVNYEIRNRDEMLQKRMWLYDNLKDLSEKCSVLSFDNLALEQLDVRRLLTDEEWEKFYMGDDGSFTFYIDLVRGVFSKDSVTHTRFEIGDKTIDEMFQFIREYYKKQ